MSNLEQKMMLNDVVQPESIVVNHIHSNTTDLSILISSLDPKDTGEIDDDIINNIIIKLKIINKTLQSFKKNIHKKYGDSVSLESGILSLIYEFNKKFEEQQLTTSSLMYDGREPRRDVLLKIFEISDNLSFATNFPILPKNKIDKIIGETLGTVDSRTQKKYFECVKGFVEKSTGQTLGYYSIYNLTGFREVVLEKLDQLERREKI